MEGNVQVNVINLGGIGNIMSGVQVEGIEKTNLVTTEDIEGIENEKENELQFGSDEKGSYCSNNDDGDVDHASRKKSRRVQFDENSEVPNFQVGMVSAVDRHVIKSRRDIKFVKNDRKRMHESYL